MSEEEITINYLVYDTEADAVARADTEGARRGYAYHRVGSGTRYHTYPQVTADDKYALLVNGYELTEDEESAITTSVTFPTPNEV
jgi:molybdate-binding protein